MNTSAEGGGKHWTNYWWKKESQWTDRNVEKLNITSKEMQEILQPVQEIFPYIIKHGLKNPTDQW